MSVTKRIILAAIALALVIVFGEANQIAGYGVVPDSSTATGTLVKHEGQR